LKNDFLLAIICFYDRVVARVPASKSSDGALHNHTDVNFYHFNPLAAPEASSETVTLFVDAEKQILPEILYGVLSY
jgi:hypothetical protein